MSYYNPPAIGGARAYRPADVSSGLGWLLPVVVALAALAALVYFSPAIRGGGHPEVAELLEDTCVLVLVSSAGEGSGFVINSEGYIVTNRHVLTGGDAEPGQNTQCQVVLRSGTPEQKLLPARVSDWGHGPIASAHDMANDWAILKVDPESPLPYLTVEDSRNAKATQPVYAAGFPGGSSNAATGAGPKVVVQEGAIRRMEEDPKTRAIVRIDHSATVRGGNSGGPLVTTRGRVIGINSQINEEAASNFATPTHRIPDVWVKYAQQCWLR